MAFSKKKNNSPATAPLSQEAEQLLRQDALWAAHCRQIEQQQLQGVDRRLYQVAEGNDNPRSCPMTPEEQAREDAALLEAERRLYKLANDV